MDGGPNSTRYPFRWAEFDPVLVPRTKVGTIRFKCMQAASQIRTLMTQPLHACRQAVLSGIKRPHAAMDVMLNLLAIALVADVQ